ncbi:hypothetical protein FXN61_44315 [Lentzea sp. PSKA42]|uniref:Uncharacterized protein n=1 Tax=Lentzea indica TaxID=2604800 RepID=A0ABX1FWT0_9PSEU|nr:hypothetical protein [Lentzea indica]NKE63375.1 hypothetical protein [Lentzea indica]
MALDLPPRRELPADVKERMRPDFTQVEGRRHSRAPLAAAAGVLLLVAGGVAVTQFVTRPFLQEPGHGHERVVTPSGQDLARCRTALNDQNWQSTEMVVFGLRKVLVGKDGRFCELTLSRAGVAADDFEPVQLEGGSIAYRSEKVVAGVPPFSAHTAKARQSYNTHANPGSFSDGVVTPDFFIIETQSRNSATELVFDERSVRMPRLPSKPAAGTDNFESGDTDPWALVNLVDRCSDNAYEAGWSAEHLQGWKPLLEVGLAEHEGMLIAHREHDKWATCTFTKSSSASVSQLEVSWDESDRPIVLGGRKLGSDYVLAGRTDHQAKTVEVSDGGNPPVTAEVEDGHFLATLSLPSTAPVNRERLHLVARNAENEIVYEGGIS